MIYEGKRTGYARRRRTNGTSRRRSAAASGNGSGTLLTLCVWIVFIAVAGRILFPDAFRGIREKALSLVTGDADYKAAIAVLSDALTGEERLSDALHKAYEYAFNASGADAVETGKNNAAASVDARDSALADSERESEAEPVFESVDYSAGGETAVAADIPFPQNAASEKRELPVTLSAPAEGPVSSGFGYRVRQPGGDMAFHYGIDIAAEKGSAVTSAADGTVLAIGDSSSYGLYVIISHDGGVKTLYAHLDSVSVSEGSSILRGGRIGEVGETGNATGPCLHFEVTADGVFVDPALYI